MVSVCRGCVVNGMYDVGLEGLVVGVKYLLIGEEHGFGCSMAHRVSDGVAGVAGSWEGFRGTDSCQLGMWLSAVCQHLGDAS